MTTIELGGNINLTGFKDLDGGSLVILKKIVGNYARKISDSSDKFEKLSLTLKNVHETEGSKKFEIHAKLVDKGTIHTSEVTDRNVFFTVDKALSSVMKQMKP